MPCKLARGHDAGGGAPAAAARAGPDDGASAILLKEPAAVYLDAGEASAAFLTPSRYEPYAGDAYEHVDVIGRGAFGLVTKMRCRADGGLVAMKTVDRSRLHTAYLQKTAHREARTLRRLGAHPNIVALREVIECDRSIHIVLELVDGCTVAELCGRAADGRLGTADAATIAAQALGARAPPRPPRLPPRR